MKLVERETPLAQLNQARLRVGRRRHGECVLVHGEAGIGKTSLVQAFMQGLEPATTNLLRASCEALYTPRPLGPLFDLADRLSPSVAGSLHAGSTWSQLFPALLGHLRSEPLPTVLAIEDMHWADAATLDLVRYLGRRLHDVALVLLLTYRSDEVTSAHPLHTVLGGLPAPTTTRIALPRLSAGAVATLAAGGARSAQRVFEVTGGNPFYVTEVLATEGTGVPPSVNDAVLARLVGLGATAREVVERVSLFPDEVDAALLKAIAPAPPEAIDACLQGGLLVMREGDSLAFRHELAREAVYQAIAPHRRRSLHAAALDALRDRGDADESLARRVHHAEGAGRVQEVMLLAPRAARHAARSGAHREAARLYALALRHGANLAPAERAELLEARALACALTSLHDEAIGARREALSLRRQLGDRRGEGTNLRWLARLHGWSDCIATAFDCAREAVAVLESLAPDAELALAYSTLSHLQLVSERLTDAEVSGSKAIALAERIGHFAALSQALDHVGTARLRRADDPAAWRMLERSLALALEHRHDPEAALAYSNLHVMALVHRNYASALRHADHGISFCEAKGIDVFAARMRVRRAFACLQTGRWALAGADLDDVRARHRLSAMEAATRDFVRALLDLRRGTSCAQEQLARAAATMRELGVRIWFTSTAAACAEAAWLRGDGDAVRGAVDSALRHALAIGDAWRAGELAAWRVRSTGAPGEVAGAFAGPYALEVAGRTRQAAEAWSQLGCPYERALALSGGDEADLRQALQLFEEQHAVPAAEAVRRRLRTLGARGVQRGPQPSTRDHPLGLTMRERQVFDLLLQGLSNAAMAARLCRSERTVEHHVAAVLAKTGVASRAGLIAAFSTIDA